MREYVIDLLNKYLPTPVRPAGGNNVATRCPFHKGGEERRPSFGVNTETGVFHCFACHVKGNLWQLLEMLQVPRETAKAELKQIQPILEEQAKQHKLQEQHSFEHQDPFKADYPLPEALLGVYELCPFELVNEGFSPDLLRDLEIGYDRENHRIMYPLRDMYGNLAGFSGKATALTRSQYPKYKVYEGRRRGANGRTIKSDFGDWFDEQFPNYRCENHDFLWNFDRVLPRIRAMSEADATVHIVEGFKACMWMIQSGFQDTVALMGSYISPRQQQMLHRLGCTVILCLDNDPPGRDATLNIGDLLWRPMYGKVKVMPYPEEDEKTQPDDYEPWFLQGMVQGSKPYLDYINSRRRGSKW
jgi:DNA primase